MMIGDNRNENPQTCRPENLSSTTLPSLKSPSQDRPPSPTGPFRPSSPDPMALVPPGSVPLNSVALAEYQHRLQFYEYATQAVRFRFSQGQPNGSPFGLPSHPALTEAASPFSALSPFARYDPRFRFMHEEPKPQHSYIGLIAMAILSNPEKKMVLSDIYQHILDHYPYFRNRGPGWRNSIRHNLSLNDCFIKSGRSANGKGHYWAIHPANIEDFTKGDFRRRKAQRKVRRHMGLSVPEDEDSQSPTPTPGPPLGLPHHMPGPFGPPDLQSIAASLQAHRERQEQMNSFRDVHHLPLGVGGRPLSLRNSSDILASFRSQGLPSAARSNKRLFDVESLLAPDCDSTVEDDERHHNFGGTRSSTPRSSSSPVDAVYRTGRTESNCSSPSVSSDVASTPPPQHRPDVASSSPAEDSSPGNHMQQSSSSSSSQPPHPYPNLTAWHLRSLQNIQQINSGLFSHGNFRGSGGENLVGSGSGIPASHHSSHPAFSAWAAMSALANQEAAANLFGYATLAAAAASSSTTSSSSSSSSGTSGNNNTSTGGLNPPHHHPPQRHHQHNNSQQNHSKRDPTNK